MTLLEAPNSCQLSAIFAPFFKRLLFRPSLKANWPACGAYH
jgi:hypothetical protein